MSFHGIPRDYFLAGDPYHCESHKTARLLAEKLGLDKTQWQLSFQSRLGPREWLRPYTDETLRKLAAEGVRKVQVICPGFSADCLETLEEIAMENRDTFLEAGGETYDYIPCLNADPAHIDMLAGLVARHTREWVPAQTDAERVAALEFRRQLAQAAGAKQ
jgi:ferrochelatase